MMSGSMERSLQNETRDYYSGDINEWLAYVYNDPASSRHFPFGKTRELIVREAISAVGGTAGLACDFGCGGGQLSLVLADAGFEVEAMDFSPTMLEEARALVERDAPGKVRFRRLDLLEDDLPEDVAGRASLAIAMGLVEYMPDLGEVVERLASALAPGGLLVVEFKNRLFNGYSGNAFTAREAESGGLGEIVEELAEWWEAAAPDRRAVDEYLTALAPLAAPAEAPPPTAAAPEPFPAQRRLHRISEIAAAGTDAGLELDRLLAMHPHPFPPAVERFDPWAYNRVAWALQQHFENPLVQMCSTSLAAVLRRQS